MIIKLNNKICKDANEAIDLIKEGKNFDLSITLDNDDRYRLSYTNGMERWYKNGKLHREDGPAILSSFDNFYGIEKHWYKNGKRHREDGPAVEYAGGTKHWYLNGKFHRENGPAVEYFDGSKFWYKNGKPHREDGPASEFTNGEKHWFKNGQLHREDGPAVEHANGSKFWYLNGKAIEEPKNVTKKLNMFTNGSDYVIAESGLEAQELANNIYGDNEQWKWIIVSKTKKFNFEKEDGTQENKTIGMFIEQHGKGYFANTEY